MTSPPATAVIVTYNSRAVIGSALDAAEEAHRAGLLDVIVVDNASADATPAFVRERYPWVRVIESGGNLGFGRGCNLGFSAVDTPYVLFLNPDAALPKAALEKLLAFMEDHPQAAIAGPATWNYGGTTLQGAGGLPTPAQIICEAAGIPGPSTKHRRPIEPGAPPFTTDWIGGAIMFCRAEHLRALGGFDPRFFLYFEETDLCRRAVAAGYELWAVGDAVANHVGSTAAKSSGERLIYGSNIATHYFRSRFYYLVKHFGWPAAAFTEGSELAFLAARSLAKKLLAKPGGSGLGERLTGPIMRLPAAVDGVDDRR